MKSKRQEKKSGRERVQKSGLSDSNQLKNHRRQMVEHEAVYDDLDCSIFSYKCSSDIEEPRNRELVVSPCSSLCSMESSSPSLISSSFVRMTETEKQSRRIRQFDKMRLFLSI
eukprot:747107-Hanusia_phi.AAC.7